jgi:hypothetical protein
MNHLITTIIFISSLHCFGQTKEQFLNSIYKVFVDTTFTKYYLYSDAYRLPIGKYDKSGIIKDFSEIISIETINELLNKSDTDTLRMTWDCKSLDIATCAENSNGILLGNYVVHTERKWSKKKQKRETERQVIEQKEKHNKKPRQERVIYSFSRPIYDSKNEYALISMRMTCGNLCGHGCIYLFKKTNGIWQFATKTNCRLK